MSTIWTRPRKIATSIPVAEPEFSVEFSTLNLKPKINERLPQNLYLIATRKNNSKVSLGQLPNDDGYLYLDEREQKLYYSSLRYDNPQYLCDWDKSIANNYTCQYYNATITNEGDILFFWRPQGSLVRQNPIIYPSGNYGNPKVISFGDNIKPFGFQRDINIEHHFSKDYFMFGEYRGWSSEDDGKELYIWKVTKPYDDPLSWRRVKTMHVRHFESSTGNFPETEIGHFHTCQYDFYSDAWLATTGDGGTRNRILISKDDGEEWIDMQLEGSATLRLTGLIFTKDFAWYQTDDAGVHQLFKVPRAADNYPIFANKIKVEDLPKNQAGYLTLYVREPNGLLLLDRAEPRYDHKFDMTFYSFKYEKLFHLGTYDRIDNGDKHENAGRHGFPVSVSTHYQSIYDDGIIVGGNSITKPFTVKVLGNNDENILGVLKIKVIKV